MRVFVTGGTGLVGARLIKRLRERRDSVVMLTRRPAVARDRYGGDCNIVEGDPTQPGPWMDDLANCDAVIHLAGENIFAKRWNEEFKALLRESRIKGTENVVRALAKKPQTAAGAPKLLVSASAVGYYGVHGDEELTEDSPPGTDFLAQLCVDWEKAAKGAEASGVRVALVRVGVVLEKGGGALAKMLTPFKLGLGGPIGSGKHWMSWVHNEDLAGIFLLPLDNQSASGPLNGTAPNPVTNRVFSSALGSTLGRPAFLPTPVFGLKLMLGEVSDVIATGQRVLPRRTQGLGFQFKYPLLESALAEVLR